MTNSFYGIYFDRYELKVNDHGQLLNPDALKIIEFEVDEELDEVVATRQIAEDCSCIEVDPDLRDLDHSGYDDSLTISKALGEFENWLEENTVWVKSSRQTYWQPAEYKCIGISGCVDEDGNAGWWDNGGKEQTLYNL